MAYPLHRLYLRLQTPLLVYSVVRKHRGTQPLVVPLPPIKIPEPLIAHTPFYHEGLAPPAILPHYKHPTLPPIGTTLNPAIFQSGIDMPSEAAPPYRMLYHHRPKA